MSFSYVQLTKGDHAPWFQAASSSNTRYYFHTAAGRYLVLCFLGTAGDAIGSAANAAILQERDLLDDKRFSFFGVSVDPADRSENRLNESIPGIRYFWDFDAAISRLYGAVPIEPAKNGQLALRRLWVILDPTLRVLHVTPFRPDGSDRAEIIAVMKALPPPELFAGLPLQAPILFLPNVFEPEFCSKLIGMYDADGGQETGFMRDVGGKTVAIIDHSHKRRRDYTVEDSEVISAIQTRIMRRIAPEIAKVHQFHVTRMERYIIGCYTAEDGGHFSAHRDNTTRATAHRRFAISINLNSDFEGGEVSFPEYGRRSFKPPPGGAVVFSCSLLHAVSQVTAGRRYAFLPFVYDDAAAKLRAENAQFLEDRKAE